MNGIIYGIDKNDNSLFDAGDQLLYLQFDKDVKYIKPDNRNGLEDYEIETSITNVQEFEIRTEDLGALNSIIDNEGGIDEIREVIGREGSIRNEYTNIDALLDMSGDEDFEFWDPSDWDVPFFKTANEKIEMDDAVFEEGTVSFPWESAISSGIVVVGGFVIWIGAEIFFRSIGRKFSPVVNAVGAVAGGVLGVSRGIGNVVRGLGSIFSRK